MFSKQQLDLHKLPPTGKAFREKVLQAHYAALQCKFISSSMAIIARFMVVIDWKWDSTNSLFEAVTTTLSPAPETIIHLIVSSCRTSFVSLKRKCVQSIVSVWWLLEWRKNEFVKIADQDIEDGYDYCTVAMKNKALKTFTM